MNLENVFWYFLKRKKRKNGLTRAFSSVIIMSQQRKGKHHTKAGALAKAKPKENFVPLNKKGVSPMVTELEPYQFAGLAATL